MIQKDKLIAQVSKKAKISAKAATAAYETILKENPAWRKQSLKTVTALKEKAVKVAGKQSIKKVQLKEQVPVEVVKEVTKFKTIEIIKEVPVEVIKEVIKEVKVIEKIPIEVIKEITHIKEVVDTKKIKELEKTISTLLKNQKIAETKAAKDAKSIKVLNDKNAKSLNDLNKASAELKKSQKETLSGKAKITKLEKQLKASLKANTELKSKYLNLEKDTKKTLAAAKANSDGSSKLEKELKTAKSDLSALKAKYAALEKESKKAIFAAKANTANTTKLAKLEQALKEVTKDASGWKAKCLKAEKNCGTHESDIKKLKAELAAMSKAASKVKTIIKEVPVEVIKEVEVVKQYDMKELMAMLKTVATKKGTRKVIGETTTKGKIKEVDRYVVGTRDDLTKIEGIGPKIAAILKVGKIYTFKDLANTAVTKLSALLDAAGPRFQMHDPGTWPQQAQLAADGKWDELKTLQDRLDGGK